MSIVFVIGIIGYAFWILHRAKKAKGESSTDKEYLLHWVPAAPSILSTIGVFGSFLGIAIGLIHAEAIAGEDFDMDSFLKSIRIVFLSSVAGLGAALTVKFRTHSIVLTEHGNQITRNPNVTDPRFVEWLLDKLRAIHTEQQKQTQAIERCCSALAEPAPTGPSPVPSGDAGEPEILDPEQADTLGEIARDLGNIANRLETYAGQRADGAKNPESSTQRGQPSSKGSQDKKSGSDAAGRGGKGGSDGGQEAS